MQRQTGFTLIELMITVVIIGILTAIAVPNYSNYVTRSRLVDAQSGLAGTQPLAERFWMNANPHTYAGLGGTGTGVLPASTQYFAFEVVDGSDTPTTYTLRARGLGQFAGLNLTIDQSGKRRTTSVPSGWTPNATDCWVRDKNGACSQ